MECITFDKIDSDKIDLISIDIEGGEWFVIKHMISRPAVVSVETHGDAYKNPFFPEIINWMKNNQYKVYYKTKTDTVFVLDTIVAINSVVKLKLMIMNLYLSYIYFGEKLKKKIYSGK